MNQKLWDKRGLARLRKIKLPLNEPVRRCLAVGLGCFLGTLFLTYLCLRDGHFSLSVRLATTHFQSELPQSLEAEGEIKALSSQKIRLDGPARIDRLMAKTGDAVKKDQVIAVVNEPENRQILSDALAHFNHARDVLTAAKKSPHAKKANPAILKEAVLAFEASKNELQTATREVEQSMVHSPSDGTLWMKIKPGDPLPADGVIAEVEDSAKLAMSVQVPENEAKELPPDCELKLSVKGAAPIEVEAGVHYASVKMEPGSENVPMQLVFPAEKIPPAWRHDQAKVTVVIPPLKNVALVDRKALVAQGKDFRVLILTPEGTLHWHKMARPHYFQDQLLFRGVSPSTFRVVLPENLERVSKAITLNAQPEVRKS